MASNVRTPEELKNPELNYFIAFKLDLGETDPAKIETAIKVRTTDTSGSLIVRRLNELKNDAIEIMCNDSVFDVNTNSYKKNAGGRAIEAKAAKEAKLNDSVHIIELLCKERSSILKSDIEKIYTNANQLVKYFTKEELYKKIEYLTKTGVNIIDNIDTTIPFQDYLDIENKLVEFGAEDLYAFLNIKRSAQKAEIDTASKEAYKTATKFKDLKKKQAGSNLCGLVQKILLQSDAQRKSYDQYLLLKNDVWDSFKQRKDFGIKELQMEEYEKYTQKVIDILKVSLPEAEKIIAIGCKFFLLTIVGASSKGGSNFEFCPFPDCGKLFVKGAKSCPHCGRALEVICWNCRAQTPFTKDDKGCVSCGATNHAHELFIKKCGSLDLIIANPNAEISAMQSAFLDIKNIVPNYASKPDCTVAKKVKEYDTSIQNRIKQEETLGVKYREELVKVQELMAKKQYQKALSGANSLTIKYPTYNLETSKKLVADIKVFVANAQRQLDSAKTYMAQGNENMVVNYAIKALELCDDYMEARQILQKYPPKPPVNLRAALDGNVVRLEWGETVKQDFVNYTIIKKIGVAPTSPDDGAVVDRGLTIKFFEDSNVVSATPYYYAVYAERYGIKSNICATMSPITVFADVGNVQQEVVTGAIKAVWQTPQNIKEVEVWKKAGAVAPLRAGDGERISCDTNGFTDNKCNGDNAYLIVCSYATKTGVVKSRGVKVVLKAYEQTEPLRNVNIKSLGDSSYVFTCAEGYSGKVSLYYSATKLSIPTDKTLKYIDFNTICKGLVKINATPNANGELTFDLPKGKIYQVYPIVATEQLFVVSPPHLLNTVSGMEISYSVSNGTVTVTGKVHEKATAIVAKISGKAFASKIDDDGEKFVFSKTDFDSRGKLEIKLKTNTVNYITLFAEFKDNGVTTYSLPASLSSPIDYRESVSVLYNMVYAVSPTKPFKVTINFEADKEVVIPKLLLMQGRPKPLNKSAGELVERLEEITLKKGIFSKKYTGKHVVTVSPISLNTKFAIFFSDDNSHVSLKEVRSL